MAPFVYNISLTQILAYLVAYPASLLVVTGCGTVGAWSWTRIHR